MKPEKLSVALIGATGYVGQRFVTLLDQHPFFQLTVLVAGPRSQGKSYKEACEGRWLLDLPMPKAVENMRVQSSEAISQWGEGVDLAFCAVDMAKEPLIALEESIARQEIPLVSNNSANRWTVDVPIIIPEINPQHLAVLESQKKRLGTKKGFIVAKPNCSVQSFLPALEPLRDLGLEAVMVSTYQAVSGAGRKLSVWPEMQANVIPYIKGEEEKTEQEPLKIWGQVDQGRIVASATPLISSHCTRVAVQEGHLANVWIRLQKNCSSQDIISRWQEYKPLPQQLGLPSAPQPFLQYLPEEDRPQPRLDALRGQGMGISIGRLRPDSLYDYKFSCLSANTIRGAAGGAVLTAELLYKQGYLN
ncbi:MAG: aspartate-semialdehyde dehydrogenase [Eubacteriales bacterium]|nr:aspartate-semialdehyde dehydrogenase [Eubacteriales bacterium]